MAAEHEFHIADRDGEVLYPRAIIRGKNPLFIKLDDPRRPGKIAFATVTASGWKIVPGFATPAQIAAGVLKAAKLGGIIGNTVGSPPADLHSGRNTAGNTASATAVAYALSQLSSNTEASEQLDARMNLKINGAVKNALEARAEEAHVSVGALVRVLIADYLGGNAAPVQSAAPAANDPIIRDAVEAFREAVLRTITLINECPATDGIPHVFTEFHRALKVLNALVEDDLPPLVIVEILRRVADIIGPVLPILRTARTNVPATRPVIVEMNGYLQTARARLVEVHRVCKQHL